jgi:CHASE2 domain-containing sensor protein
VESFLRRRFWQRAIFVLIVVLAFNAVVELDWFRNNFPFVQRAQLRFHRFLCSLIPRPISPRWVRVVAIDTDLHRELKEPTDRKFLATLVTNAAAGRAAAIVLDFKFVVPKGRNPGVDTREMLGHVRARLAVPRAEHAEDHHHPVVDRLRAPYPRPGGWLLHHPHDHPSRRLRSPTSL